MIFLKEVWTGKECKEQILRITESEVKLKSLRGKHLWNAPCQPVHVWIWEKLGESEEHWMKCWVKTSQEWTLGSTEKTAHWWQEFGSVNTEISDMVWMHSGKMKL